MIIYKITNVIDNKSYIGQTIDSFVRRYGRKKRWSQCCNPYLEHAINKYGDSNFKIELLQENVVSLDKLNELEEYYISKYNTIYPNGYNFKKGGNNKFHHELTKLKIGISHEKIYKFKNPNGEIITIKNLSKFCKNNNLSNELMIGVCHRRRNQHRGWTRIDTILPKDKKFISPDGKIFTIKHREMKPFCRKHNLCNSGLIKVWNEEYTHHNGWRKYKENNDN